jgi:signal transduction histidine kinase
MRANVMQESIRTASAARRVVEDLVAPRAAQQGVGIDDNLMVWVSRLIDQDVNIFSGPRLLATSERNLFASGLLPTRTPADVYHALELRNEATTVIGEQIGALEYLVAGTSMATSQMNTMLTVPLTSRQQEIEAQIDTLDRRVLLGALLFVFGGASIGYWLAERIADPVNRLTRATARLARGDFDARIAITSTDELRRLVEAFNQMAAELQRQQGELERTHRLEAWAEMARQVAHEIKNPLTPIQLNAEHLRRVHADRGEPLGPMLDECVATILVQVKLLRQIASEFSSFASSPTAKPSPVDVPDLVRETIDPYRKGLGDRIRFDVDVPPNLPARFRRSHPHCTVADQHRRERPARDAGSWLAQPRGARGGFVRTDSRVGYRRWNGCRSAGPSLRALLLHQEHRDGPGPSNREEKCGIERWNDQREQRTESRDDRRTDAPRLGLNHESHQRSEGYEALQRAFV